MKKVLCILVFLCSVFFIYANESESKVNFDFINQEISDIVYAVSLAFDMSIICDDTVEGRASFRFNGNNFEEATNAFLLANKLYAYTENNTVIVSKIAITEKSGLYSISASDVLPSVIFTKLARKSSIPITYELLPSIPTSIHIENKEIEEIVTIIMQSFSDYSVEVAGNYVNIRKSKYQNSMVQNESGIVNIECNDGIFSVSIQDGSLYESIEKLFVINSADFSNLLPNDRLITRLEYSSANFDAVLSTICAQSEADFTFFNNLYAIYGVENASNKVKHPDSFWKTIDLQFISQEDFIPLFKQRFSDNKIISFSSASVQIELRPQDEKEITDFILECDLPKNSHLIELKYLKTSEFLDFLPPGFLSNQFFDTGTGYSLFYTGSESSFAILNKIIADMDKPATIIGYDLLVLEVQESESFKWKPSFSAGPVKLGDKPTLGGHIDSGFAFNFDIVSVFGYTFATELQTAIGENRAQVYVDTQLQGISGKPIEFQNTNTFRYQDTAVDPDTGKPVYSGVTREIIAGLVISIDGWASGDGMVTTKVSASLSRRGSDVSSSGYLPPTSEKVITTEVQGRSGEPIVLSGLMQNDSTFVEDGVPGVSKIPLLGWLFKSSSKSEERTEMIIYLVPHVLSSQENF